MRSANVDRVVSSAACLALAIAAGCSARTSLPAIGARNAAVTGDPVFNTKLPAAAQCPALSPSNGTHIGTAVAVVLSSLIDPSVKSPFLLVTSCDTTNTDAGAGPVKGQLFFIDPDAGSSPPVPKIIKTMTTTGDVSEFGWGSLALRGDRGDFIGCTSNSDQHHDIYKIDIKTGIATKRFTAFPGDDICDGVSWDATTQTVYQSPDISSTVYLFQVDAADQPLGGFNADGSAKPTSQFPVPSDCLNSGVAVSGNTLFAACDGEMKTYRLDKTTGAVINDGAPNPFTSGDQRTEDLECDPFTFGNLGKDVLWTKEAYKDEVFAYEIPRGSCNIAGAPPVPPPVIKDSCCPANQQGDTDGDGLLDCWEIAGGIDFDCDGHIDLNLNDTKYTGGGPDMNRKDVYVEIDFMAGATPLDAALTDVRAAFGAAPVQLPNQPGGINLHYFVDDQVTSSTTDEPFTVLQPCTGPGSATDKPYDYWRDNFFGTAAERAAGGATLDAKRMVFHYMLFAHHMAGADSVMGCAEVPGNDILIAVDNLPTISVPNMEGVVFHELGHNLGLRHGGPSSNVDNKPNYVSVMNSALAIPSYQSGRKLNFSNLDSGPWDETKIIETTGVPQAGLVLPTVYFDASGNGIAINTSTPVDFNGDGVKQATALPSVNPGTGALLTDVNLDHSIDVLDGAKDWPNLIYNFRGVPDYSPAVHLSVGSTVEVPASVYIAGSPDRDGDGIVDAKDNCPLVANADQLDANRNGIGDACEIAPTACLEHHGTLYAAHFGYVNPNLDRTIPIGSDNVVDAALTSGTQPTAFGNGTHADQFVVSFDGPHKDTVTWHLNGVSLTVDKHLALCR